MKAKTKFLKFIFTIGVIFTFNYGYSQTACNPSKIYDELQSSFHSTIATLPNGSFLCWGDLMAPTGAASNLSPVAITPANGYNYTGTVLFASLGSQSFGNVQSFLLTTTGLYAWGTEGVCINGASTTSVAFQSIAMPSGLLPSQVRDMVATRNALTLLTTTGELWVNAVTVDMYGAGATAPVAPFWARVTTSAVGNPVLTGITDYRLTPRGAMAYVAGTGTWYTWGTLSYLGNGSAAAVRNRATPMTAPFVGNPLAITMTSDNAEPSYFALNPVNNKIYSMGNNVFGQLGRNNQVNQTGWVIVQNPTNTGDLTNVKFIAGNDQDGNTFGAVGCITTDKRLYIWGSNAGLGMIAQTAAGPFLLPASPNGFVFGTDNPQYLEVGGHTSAYLKECSDRYCYTGHKINGSMGDGVAAGSFITTFDCLNTPQAVICGASSFDSGDVPNSFESTNFAAHYYKCPAGIYLGAITPISNNGALVNVVSGASNVALNGDGLEEDGISTITTYTGTGSYSLTVNATNTSVVNGFIYAWVDWNENGVFELSEFQTANVNTGTNAANFVLNWLSLPNTITCGRKYVRIRITSDVLVDDSSTSNLDERSRGSAIGGEVEDYFVDVLVANNAGMDQSLTCNPIASCSATMNGTGLGIWTANFGNPGTSTITTPTSATTTISNFSAYGNYNYTFTNGTCSDVVTITVLSDLDRDGIPDDTDLDDDNDGITDMVEGGPVCASTVAVSMNTVPYTYNTGLNTSPTPTTQSPVNVNNLISGSLNYTGTLVGSTTWNSLSNEGLANSSGGVQIKNNSVASVGDYIYHQPVNTNTTSTTLANTTNYAQYELLFSSPVLNLSFISAGLNNLDTYEIYAFNGATPIPLDPSNLSGFLPVTNWNVIDLGDGLKVVSTNGGGTEVDNNLFTTSVLGNLTRIEIRSYKNSTGATNTTGNVTTAITSLIYCTVGPFLDTDLDGTPNYLDLDSDQDGCSDSNEYYNNNTSAAAGQQFGQTGSAVAPTNANGTVNLPAATYTGSYANAINNTVSSACVVAFPTPDFNAGNVGTTIPGSVATNDTVPVGTTYSNPVGSGLNPNTVLPVIAPDGSYTFSPTLPGVYTFEVEYCVPSGPIPCPTETLVITVVDPLLSINPPVANNDTSVTPLNTPVTIVVTANDGPGNTGGTLATPTLPLPTSANGGTVSVDGLGNIVYTPATGFTGVDTFTYNVCETPSGLCTTATVEVTVLPSGSANTTLASDDYDTTINGSTATGDVTVNDTDPQGNTQTVTPQSVTLPEGVFNLLADGSYTFVPASGFTGTVAIPYTTCDNGLPVACSDATLYIVSSILPDTTPDFNAGNVGTTIPGSVATNDTVPVGTTYSNPVGSGLNPNTVLPVIAPDGSYTFSPTLPGVYTFEVEYCVPSGPIPCPTETLVITVVDPLLSINPPVANNDTSVTPLNTPVTIVVTANDGPGNTGGTLATPTLPLPTSANGGTVSVDGLGNIVYTPATGFTGVDTFTYNVCETPSGLCTTATVEVTVLPSGSANTTLASDDYDTTINGSTATGDVTVNDTDPQGNTQTVTPQSVTLPEGVFNLLADGSYTFVPASGFTGTVAIPYTTCDNGLPVACSDATLYIVVNNNIIDAVDDNTYPTQTPSTTVPTVVGNVTANDTLNGVLVTPTNTDVTPITTGPLSINVAGVLTLAPNTPSGTYTILYQLCELNTVTGFPVVPANCDTATATVVVLNPIVAVVDVYPTQVPSTTVPTTVGNVTANDTLNGVLVTPTNTDVTPVTNGPLSIDANGVLTLAPNTPSGSYPITYTICEVNPTTGIAVVPANCSTTTDTIVVLNPIVAVVDIYPTQVPSTTVPTTVGNVTDNDTLNGVLVTPTNTDVTPVTNGPLSIDANGVLTLAPNTPSGSYPITYTICEVNPTTGLAVVPANCSTITDTVVVLNPIVAVVDVYPTQVPSTTGPTTVGNVTANDTLNGVLVTPTNTDVTPVTNGPLSIDANGVLTLAPNTPSGSYPITYTICEVNPTTGLAVVPANCSTTTDTVVVLNPIVAVVDIYPTQTPSTTVPVVVGDVTVNDTLNGVIVTANNTDVTPVTSGPLTINANGILTLAPNTPSGSYPITYTICEINPTTGLAVAPPNCSTTTDTVVVLNPIVAVVDVYPTQVPSTTVPTTVGNVTANDTLNGVLVTPTNTDVTPVTSGPLSIDANGVLTLAPNTPSGSYPITYTICEVNPTTGLAVVPANCSTTTDTVVVLNPIVAVVDIYPTQVPSTTVPTTVGNVTDNDTLNGVLVTPTNTDVTPVTNGPLSIDANGVLTLAPNTPSGSYPITYTICEVNPTTGLAVVPANCSTITDTVVVLNPIVAVVDVYPTQVPSTTGPTTVGNVTANDTLNGVLVTPTNTDVTPVTNGPLSIDANGVLTLAPNTPSGSYPITYTICEVNPTTGLAVVPANCSTTTDTVVVLNPIVAVVDIYPTQTPSTTVPLVVGDVTVNDTLNGVIVTANNTDVTPVTNGPLTINANGILTLAPNTPSGSYPITYTICEINPTTGLAVAPPNCSTTTDTVVVLNPIVAVVDVYPTQVPSTTVPTTVGNVTDNDTLNGVLVTPTNTDVTPVTNGPLSIDANGVLTLAPNTPSGSYPITYTICEVNPTTGIAVVPANCSTTTDTIVVLNPIVAVVDIYPTQVPSTTVPTTVGNVTDNDTLNGVLVTPTNTDVTPVTNGPLSIDANGVLTLAPNTPSGSYPITYTICEVNPTTGIAVVPANCSTTTDTVVVLNPIVAVVDVYPTQVPSTTGPTTVGNVTANDTLNGVLVTPTNTDVTPVTNGPLSIDANGVLTLAPNTPSGSYPITYTICEVNPTTGLAVVPANCSTTTDTIVVLNPIVAVVDIYPTQTPSTTVPVVVGDVTVNDTLNGVIVTANNTDVTPVTNGPLTINANGILTLAPNTPSGSYPITYTICEINPTTGLAVAPPNCSTTTDTVVVLNPIVAVVDVYPTQVPSTTVPTTVGNVTANDTLNGVLVTPTNTDVTPVTSGPLSIDANGVLTLAPNTPSGSYPITYTICEVNPTTGLAVVPANCSTTTDTVVVLNPIVAIDDIGTPVLGSTGGISLANVLVNDTLNGIPATLATVTITQISTTNSGVTVNPANGSVNVAPGTPGGTYTIVYQICEIGAVPVNCDTATVTVFVQEPGLSITKDGTFVDNNNNGITNVGDTIIYNFVVTNTGNVPLTNITVTDINAVVTGGPLATLAVGATDSTTFTAVHILTQADIDAGQVDNLASVTGNPPLGPPITVVSNDPTPCAVCVPLDPSCTSCTIVTLVTSPSIAIIKTAQFNDDNGDGFAQVGETITYNFTVTNTGNVTLSNVDISDPLPGVSISGGPITLAPGQIDSTTFVGTYTLTLQDLINGSVTNQALVTGSTPLGQTAQDLSDNVNNTNDNPTVINISECLIEVFNFLSPNQSIGENDTFNIRGIECYPDNTVEIYNRWGVLVYETKAYDNVNKVFRGVSEGRVTINQNSNLPDGTYFYVLRYTRRSGESNEKAGYLYINN